MGEQNQIQEQYEKSKLLLTLSLIAGGTSFVLCLLIFFPGIVYEWAGLDIYALALVPFLMTTVFALASAAYGMLSRKTAQEKEEKLLLERTRSDRSAFDMSEDVRFTSEQSFINYCKYAPPVLALLGAVFIALILILFWRYWGTRVEKTLPASSLHSAFVAAIFMCTSLFAGAFCLGQSREKLFRWLRPVGAWFIAGFLTTLFAVFAALMNHFGHPWVDRYVTNIMFVVFAVLGLEFIVNFVTEFYRPRTLEEERPVFESRLLALFTEPGGVVRNMADTLDYQFGFKVSKTWIYGFVEKSIFPLIIMWLITLWLFTCLAQVGPNEIGVRERFGEVLSKTPLPSGIYLKFPWPFGKIRRFPAYKIQEIIIGPGNEEETKNKERPRIILWSKQHYKKESQYIVASEKDENSSKEVVPVSFLSASLPVQFTIRPDRILDYAYKNKLPTKILKNIGEMVATKYFASADMLKVMSTDRHKTAEDIKRLIQEEADRRDLGVDILFVNLHDAHPPVGKVAEAFQNVIGAREERQTEIQNAKTYAVEVSQNSEAESQGIVMEAEAYKDNTIQVAEAESNRFYKQLAAYNQMPGMFKLRTYLDFLENDCKKVRKYIMSSSIPYEIYEINMEEKTRLDLIDADLSELSK